MHCRSSWLEQSPQDQCTTRLWDPGSKGISEEIAQPPCSAPNMPWYQSWGCEARSNPDSPRRGGGQGFASHASHQKLDPLPGASLSQAWDANHCQAPQPRPGGVGEIAPSLLTASPPPYLPLLSTCTPPLASSISSAIKNLSMTVYPSGNLRLLQENFPPEARPSWR